MSSGQGTSSWTQFLALLSTTRRRIQAELKFIQVECGS